MTEPAPTPEAKPETPAATPEAPKPGSTPAETPAEDKTDWKAEARKWEGLAKADKDAAAEWRKYQDSQATEDEKRAAKERALEQRATAAESKLLRSDVADAKKVPVEWREFLTGSTQEDLEASADKILTLIADKKGTTPDPNQGNPTAEPTGDFLRDSVRR